MGGAPVERSEGDCARRLVAQWSREHETSPCRCRRADPDASTGVVHAPGRAFLPEYRALRADRGMLESCFDPAMVCEITMQPVRRHDTDGAILFSDIVVPLKAAGIDLDIVAGTGPVIVNPVRSATDVAAVGRLVPEAVGAIGRAVSLLRAELDPTPTALIGFAGAPFTLASHLIEGGPSRHYANTRR